jgi:hypothetical protein
MVNWNLIFFFYYFVKIINCQFQDIYLMKEMVPLEFKNTSCFQMDPTNSFDDYIVVACTNLKLRIVYTNSPVYSSA